MPTVQPTKHYKTDRVSKLSHLLTRYRTLRTSRVELSVVCLFKFDSVKWWLQSTPILWMGARPAHPRKRLCQKSKRRAMETNGRGHVCILVHFKCFEVFKMPSTNQRFVHDNLVTVSQITYMPTVLDVMFLMTCYGTIACIRISTGVNYWCVLSNSAIVLFMQLVTCHVGKWYSFTNDIIVVNDQIAKQLYVNYYKCQLYLPGEPVIVSENLNSNEST